MTETTIPEQQPKRSPGKMIKEAWNNRPRIHLETSQEREERRKLQKTEEAKRMRNEKLRRAEEKALIMKQIMVVRKNLTSPQAK